MGKVQNAGHTQFHHFLKMLFSIFSEYDSLQKLHSWNTNHYEEIRTQMEKTNTLPIFQMTNFRPYKLNWTA